MAQSEGDGVGQGWKGDGMRIKECNRYMVYGMAWIGITIAFLFTAIIPYQMRVDTLAVPILALLSLLMVLGMAMQDGYGY